MQKHSKILLTSGCSFTFEEWNWPSFVSKEIGYDLVNVGMGSSGNGLISKKVIYNVTNLLQTYRPEDIMVGVMWSGFDRHEFYIDNPVDFPSETSARNPDEVVPSQRNWFMVNGHWQNPYAKLWYENLHTTTGAMVTTLENILRTQWFLDKHSIKYFMTTYMDLFSFNSSDHIMNKPDIKYLYDLVDFKKFLPVRGCHEWVKEHYQFQGGFNQPDKFGNLGIHPTEFGHQKFTNEIILPYLKSNFQNL